MKLIFVTGNRNKLREARQILKGHDISGMKVELPELQGKPIDIAKRKAAMAAEIVGETCFVEDTALSFDALSGMPGPYIKDFEQAIGVEKLPRLLDGFSDKKASAIVTIGYCEPGKAPKVFQGVVRGKIVEARGISNFGWDPIFQPAGKRKTFAEMPAEEKNRISHRKKAFEKFNSFLER